MKIDDEIYEKMHNGSTYLCVDEALLAIQAKQLDLLFEYNQLRPSKKEEKKKLLRRMFKSIGENVHIETPFHANWGGKFVTIGNHFYANFNLTMVDDTQIIIGDHVMIGPNVTLATGTHPINPDLRKSGAQYNLAIHIEDNVWIGANVVVMPGVTIGKNTIIGAGSIVTKSIPDNVIAVGTPCKVLRKIADEDYETDWNTNYSPK